MKKASNVIGKILETLLHFMERVHIRSYNGLEGKNFEKIFEWRWAEQSEAKGSHKMQLEFLMFRIEPRSWKKNVYFKELRM